MKTLFDYFPIVAFFAAYFISGQDIMTATWVIIVACAIQVVAGRLVFKKFDKMYLMVFTITLVFGGLALLFDNDAYIKWKPTVVSLVLAGVLLGGHFLQRNFIERLLNAISHRTMGFRLTLQSTDWNRLNMACVIYFIVTALLNLYIAFNFSTTFWVNFSLFGFGAIQMLFFILLFMYIYKRLPEDERQKLLKDNKDT